MYIVIKGGANLNSSKFSLLSPEVTSALLNDLLSFLSMAGSSGSVCSDFIWADGNGFLIMGFSE